MNLYVGNLAHAASEDEVRALFQDYGMVDTVNLIVDRETGRSKGFGFVVLPNDTEAQAAIDALNGYEFMGRALTVNEARPREERPFNGGGGGGGYNRPYNNDRRPYDGQRNNNYNRPYNNDRGGENGGGYNRPYNNDRGGFENRNSNYNRPYNNDRPAYNNDRPQYNNDRPQYNQNRDNNNQTPNNEGYNRPYQPRENNFNRPFNNDRPPYNQNNNNSGFNNGGNNSGGGGGFKKDFTKKREGGFSDFPRKKNNFGAPPKNDNFKNKRYFETDDED